MALRDFSDEEMRMLSRVIQRERQSVQNPRSRPGQDRSYDENQDWLAPEVYIAKPTASISALQVGVGTGTGMLDQPGYGTADIYRISGGSLGEPRLLKAFETNRRVCNITGGVLSTSDWTIAIRDKYGSWLLVNPSQNSRKAVYILQESGSGLPIPICRQGTIEYFGDETEELILVSEYSDGSSPFYANPSMLKGILFTGQRVTLSLIDGVWYIASDSEWDWIGTVGSSFVLPGTGSGTGSSIYFANGSVYLPYWGGSDEYPGLQEALVSMYCPLSLAATLTEGTKVFVTWDNARLRFNVLISGCPSYTV